MLGKNHIITGAATSILLTDAFVVGDNLISGRLRPMFDTIADFLGNIFLPENKLPHPYGLILGCILFFLGCLLPDIDNENSFLGKIIHLPVKHRTWTHAIYIPLILGMISYFVPYISWLTWGYVLHLLWDNCSRGGVCFFYPLSRYVGFENGGQIKNKHWYYLYRTGEVSEYAVVIVVTVISLGVSILLLQKGFYTSPFGINPIN